jgi:hypothetical protein
LFILISFQQGQIQPDETTRNQFEMTTGSQWQGAFAAQTHSLAVAGRLHFPADTLPSWLFLDDSVMLANLKLAVQYRPCSGNATFYYKVKHRIVWNPVLRCPPLKLRFGALHHVELQDGVHGPGSQAPSSGTHQKVQDDVLLPLAPIKSLPVGNR